MKGKISDSFVLKPIKEAWTDGDFITKLSFFILGAGNFCRKQIIKGLLFLGAEIGFLIFMLTTGFAMLSQFGSLGTQTQHTEFNESGIEVTVNGDNSMLILLGCVAIFFLIAAFAIVWRTNIKAAYKTQKLQEKGKKIPTFFEDVKDLFDSQLHKTLLSLPVLGIVVFNLIPLVFMVCIAFTNYNAKHQPPARLFDWVGFSNFTLLFDTKGKFGSTFFAILVWTFIWAIFATFLNYIFGMLLAIIINRKGTKCKRLWRTMFVISIAVPQFVSLLLIRIMLKDYGPINTMLTQAFHFKEALPFLTDGLWAKVTIIIVNLWVGMPYTMLVTTGILQNIPEDLYESARVDGANPVVIFWKITLPYMLFVTTPKLITDFVGNLNNFNVIFFLTAGEPLNQNFFQAAGETDLLVTWLYKLTVDKTDYCYAAVIGIAVFVISATLSLITYRNTASYKNEEGFQ